MRPTCCAAVTSVLCLAAPALAAPLVTSDSDCPSAVNVMARLTGLWSGDDPVSAAAHIRVGLGQMTVDLVSEHEPVVNRSLPAEPDCEARAQAAALVIAAWLGSRPSGPLGEVEPATAPPIGLASLRAPRPSSPVQPPAPTHTAQLSRSAQSPAPAQPPSLAPPRLSLGIGAFASVDARGGSAVLSAEVGWMRLVGRVGAGAGLSLPLPREMAVGQGQARWWRPVLALGLRVPLSEGIWIVQGSVGPALGLLVVVGSGFPQNHTDAVVCFGATAGFRLARRSRGRAFWAELRGLLWPAAQNIRNDVPGAAPHLEAVPRVEADLGLGVSFGAF
jgi:hypothetical protein